MKTSFLLALPLLVALGCAVRASVPGASFAVGPYCGRPYGHDRRTYERAHGRPRPHRWYDDRY